jgi:hypothetical protein
MKKLAEYRGEGMNGNHRLEVCPIPIPPVGALAVLDGYKGNGNR